ncbi:MAG: hypothetical protein ABSD47_20195, partial [Candidatus Methylomirabilota bacterium]
GGDADNDAYVREALAWICRAQDASGDGGVAHSFSLTHGWDSSYPETTGYIIPTMFHCAQLFGEGSLRERAVRMADWLVQIQLDCGGIQAGTISAPEKVATVFNTGQVLFGWTTAYEETRHEAYLRAILRAADWLVQIQDADGAWRTSSSPHANYSVNTYNVRTAWALYRAYEVTGRTAYRDASLRNVRWALTQQTPTGWFKLNCLSDETNPLTHTIAYAIEGILATGISSGEESFVDAAKRAADALLAAQRRDGSLAGRYADGWTPSASWTCLTGNAQMAVIWSRLYQLCGEDRYLGAARTANRYVKSRVNLSAPEAGIRGGVSGSWPLWGPYGRFRYLNWAAKFFLDALMLEDALTSRRHDHTAFTG